MSKSKPEILVTPRSVSRNGHPSLDRLTEAGFELCMPTPGEQPSESVLLATLPGCVGYLAGIEPITSRVLQASDGLKVISRNGTGIDNVDLEAAEKLGIAVLRAEGSMARGVAELTIGLMLSLMRHIHFGDAQLKRSVWLRQTGSELYGRRLGIIGCGKIGRLVARLAHCLGMNVVGYDSAPGALSAELADTMRVASFDEVVSTSDVISLHCPSAPGEPPMLDAAAIARMKRGVYIVNTARGELLDDEAVLDALESGQIAGLAIDTFRQEPPGSCPLVFHERVVATPHIGAITHESMARTMELTVENLLGVLTRR